MRRLPIYFFNAALLVGIIFIFRCLFLFKFGQPSALAGYDILKAFLVGLRFDLSATAYMLIPLAIGLFIPIISAKKRYLNLLTTATMVWMIILTIYLAIDYFYYPFSFRHMSYEFFNTTGDIMPMIKVGIKEYPIEIILLFISIAFFIRFHIRYSKTQTSRLTAVKTRPFMEAIGFVIIAVFTAVSARGGFQMKPLKLSNAFVFEEPFLGNLALNGIFTTLTGVYGKKHHRQHLLLGSGFCPIEDARKSGPGFLVNPSKETVIDPDYPLFRMYKFDAGDMKPLNVVIFIMESWSAKFTGSLGGSLDATPFFTKLSKGGMLFSNFYANGQRSNEGIPATLTSIPPFGGMILSDNPLLSQMPVRFLPTILKEYGYSTFFIHGGKLGTMGFDSLARHAGIETYISKDEILQQGAKEDGAWGVFDEDAFLYAHRLFDKQEKPFLGVIFSLSSHTPYNLPSKEFNFYGKETPNADFLNSLRYSDYALSKFFEKASASRYFKDTVFIIIGDHAEGRATQDDVFDRFHIPCLIFSPGRIKPAVIDIPGTQADIAPTALDILHCPSPHASIGSSLLDGARSGVGLLAYGDNMVFIDKDLALVSTPEKPLGLFRRGLNSNKDLTVSDANEAGRMKRELDCYAGFIDDLYLRNRLFKPKTQETKR